MLVIQLSHFRNTDQVKSFIYQMWTLPVTEKVVNTEIQPALEDQLGEKLLTFHRAMLHWIAIIKSCTYFLTVIWACVPACHLHNGLWAWEVFTEQCLHKRGVTGAIIHIGHVLHIHQGVNSSWQVSTRQLQREMVASRGLPRTTIHIKNARTLVSTSGNKIFTNIHEVVKTWKANSTLQAFCFFSSEVGSNSDWQVLAINMRKLSPGSWVSQIAHNSVNEW